MRGKKSETFCFEKVYDAKNLNARKKNTKGYVPLPLEASNIWFCTTLERAYFCVSGPVTRSGNTLQLLDQKAIQN